MEKSVTKTHRSPIVVSCTYSVWHNIENIREKTEKKLKKCGFDDDKHVLVAMHKCEHQTKTKSERRSEQKKRRRRR